MTMESSFGVFSSVAELLNDVGVWSGAISPDAHRAISYTMDAATGNLARFQISQSVVGFIAGPQLGDGFAAHWAQGVAASAFNRVLRPVSPLLTVICGPNVVGVVKNIEDAIGSLRGNILAHEDSGDVASPHRDSPRSDQTLQSGYRR